jgi:predicted nucleic acid-binding protein
MIRAFVDSSVLFAAIHSATGGARELLKRHTRGELQLVVSEYVLDETHNNLRRKSPENVGVVAMLVDLLALDIVEVDAASVKAAAAYTELKDAPVVAAALAGGCQYVLTHDQKHLLKNPEVPQRTGLIVVTPGDLLQKLRSE